MPSIRIHSFGGMVPKSNRALKKGNIATLAENVDLGSGTLMGYREPLLVAPGGAPNKTIHETVAGWLRFPGVVDVVDGLPGCPRILIAGEGIAYPRWATAPDAVAGEYVRLGLPVPEPVEVSGGKATFSLSHANTEPARTITTPTTTVTTPSGSWANSGSYGGSTVTINGATFDETLGESPVEWRAYVITYKDSFGNEGAPSLPSERIAVDDGSPVTVALPPTPALPWDVASICLYRASGGHWMNEQDVTTEDFHLVTELPAGTGSFTDALANLDIDAEPLVSYSYTPAPDYLQHMVAEPNGTQLAGAAGREVWFSEPHEFQAWPEKYRLTLDDDIVALCWADTGLYALTDGPPYWIGGKVDEFGYRDVFRFAESLPCASKPSICKTSDGAVVYAHKDGLVVLGGKDRASMGTLGLWGESSFQQLDPAGMVCAVYNGVWFGFTDAQGWMFSLKAVGVHSGSDQPLVTLTLRPTALHKSRNDRFYLALPDGISEWEQGDNILPWRWLGRLSVSPAQMNMAAFKTVFEKYPHEYQPSPRPIHIAFLTDDRTLYERDIDHSRPARLPHGWRHLGFELDVRGYGGEPWRQAVEIRDIHMASSLAELSESGAAN